MKFFKVACLLIAPLCCLGHKVDIPEELMHSGYNGTAAVHAVLTVIESTQIFQNYSHHRFLRRLANVTSNDGTTYFNDDLMLAGGGIWGIDDNKLNAMRETAKNSTIGQELRVVDKRIDDYLGVKILEKKQVVALKPIYGGAAAYLYLYYLMLLGHIDSVPLAENKIGQADLWVNHFCIQSARTPCCKEYFVAQVAILEEQEGCNVHADIFFVLDMSNSISEDEFNDTRDFVSKFVNGTTIGPNDTQVGVITYGNEAKIHIYLNNYTNPSDLLHAIDTIRYNSRRQGTSTADGLCKLFREFEREGNGARNTSATVYRFAVVVSDGRSNVDSKDCKWDTLEAAKAVHALTPRVLVYTVGVSNEVNEKELKDIATDESYYAHISDFNFDGVQEDISEDMCWKATVNYEEGTFIDGTLYENQVVRYQLAISQLGVTIQVCAISGTIDVYGSASHPNPNSVLNDFQLKLHCEGCQDHDKCENITRVPQNNRRKRSLSDEEGNNHPTIYISITGLAKVNHFVLNSTEGIVTMKTVVHETTTNTIRDTPDDPKGEFKKRPHTVAAAVGSTGFVLFVISCILIACSIYIITVYRAKKKQEEKGEEECGLLDMEYTEM